MGLFTEEEEELTREGARDQLLEDFEHSAHASGDADGVMAPRLEIYSKIEDLEGRCTDLKELKDYVSDLPTTILEKDSFKAFIDTWVENPQLLKSLASLSS